jgi:hypothetical protein
MKPLATLIMSVLSTFASDPNRIKHDELYSRGWIIY